MARATRRGRWNSRHVEGLPAEEVSVETSDLATIRLECAERQGELHVVEAGRHGESSDTSMGSGDRARAGCGGPGAAGAILARSAPAPGDGQAPGTGARTGGHAVIGPTGAGCPASPGCDKTGLRSRRIDLPPSRSSPVRALSAADSRPRLRTRRATDREWTGADPERFPARFRDRSTDRLPRRSP